MRAARKTLALAAALACAGGAHAAVTADFADRWIAADSTVTLQLDQALAARAAELRFFAGALDVTAIARRPRPGVLSFDLRFAQLAAGESTFVAYLVEAGKWQAVARIPLKVLSAAGFESGQFGPKLDLGGKSRFDEGRRGDATASARPTYFDGTGRGGFGFDAARGAFKADGQFNATGSSYRNEALRFGELGAQAPKTDLADYVVNLRYGGTTLAVGHLSYGNNPLLLAGYASRGVTLAQKFGERFDVSVNAMNGTSIVGYDNFFGLTGAQHRIHGASAGLELIGGRPGALRFEIAALDAKLESRGNFNRGEVPDAEESRGLGVRLSGRTTGNRVRGDAVFARSSYVNPFDPALAQGGELQPVKRSSANGRQLDFAVDLVQNSTRWSQAQPLTVTLSARHERIEPLYKSIGASSSPDQQLNRAALATQFGAAQLQFTGSRQEDNLDDVPTILKTRTDNAAANLSLPLAQWFGAWWPQARYTLQTVRQRAINTPVTADSGIAASHRPDQSNRSHQAALNFTRGAFNFGYSIQRSTQDNRQPGRENADFENLGHQVTLGFRVSEKLNLNFGANTNRNYSREKDLTTTTRGGHGGFDWQLLDSLTLAANAGRTLGGDSRDLTAAGNNNAQGQLTWRFGIPADGRKLPGQVFVRYVRQENTSRDTSFGLSARGASWAWDAGLSLSLF
ncbi:hypothetical protein FBR04_06050 [Betaproteobacteria bacterium PRO7]|jgi:hypothetical protein|nr:hypothetical protein [Betaproteobacteria bacterium PRO7]